MMEGHLQYQSFSVANEEEKYLLILGSYSGAIELSHNDYIFEDILFISNRTVSLAS